MSQRTSEIAVMPPPWWFVWLIAKLSPYPGPNTERTYLLDNLWPIHPSVFQVFPRILSKLPSAIWSHSLRVFCRKMAAAELCVLIWFGFFADQHTWAMVLLLGLTYAAFLVREAYVVPSERLFHELVTALSTAPLVLFLDAGLGLISPKLLVPAGEISPLLGSASLVIAIFRYHTAPEVGPEHPYKELMRQHERTWYRNDFWLILWFGYLLALELAAPSKWALQPPLTVMLASMCFTTAIRFQLNPISGNYRHRLICITLSSDPYQDDVRMKRDYLLVGADWFGKLCVQSVLEMLAFLLAGIPLMIAAIEWYIGDPNVARFCGYRIGLCVFAYVTLLVTWRKVKELNRQTCRVSDQTIQGFGRV
jgi:hypothetical protein